MFYGVSCVTATVLRNSSLLVKPPMPGLPQVNPTIPLEVLLPKQAFAPTEALKVGPSPSPQDYCVRSKYYENIWPQPY